MRETGSLRKHCAMALRNRSGSALRSAAVAAALAFLAACATSRPLSTPRDPPLAARVQAPGLLFELQYTQPDGAEVGRIGSSLLAAGPRLSRWGSFRQSVRIRIFPDHDSLELELRKKNYPWLRAWAFGDQILLQSPRSWNSPSPTALQGDLSELLLHELTHALMYQLITPDDAPEWAVEAPFEEPPFWFREGMASVTAGQGHRRMAATDLKTWIVAHPGADLLRPTPELYRTENEAVYGAAHRAFELLLELSGDQAVRHVLRGVRAGARFGDAFAASTGWKLAAFEDQAVRWHFNATALRDTGRPNLGSGGP